MTLPTTGSITLQDVWEELGNTGNAKNFYLGDADVRDLAGKPSGVIWITDLRGKTHYHEEEVSSNYTRSSPGWNTLVLNSSYTWHDIKSISIGAGSTVTIPRRGDSDGRIVIEIGGISYLSMTLPMASTTVTLPTSRLVTYTSPKDVQVRVYIDNVEESYTDGSHESWEYLDTTVNLNLVIERL